MEQAATAKAPGFLEKSFTLRDALSWFGVLLALLVLGAHYFRAGNSLMVAALAVVCLLHFGKAAWKRLVVGAFLAFGAVEWAMSISALIQLRLFLGLPWVRGAAILGAVGFLTALAALHCLGKGKKSLPEGREDAELAMTASFLVVFGLAYAIRLQNPGVLVLERLFPLWGGIELALLAWYAASITGGLLSKRSRRTRKMAWMFFSLVFFAQLALGLFGIPALRTLENAHLPIPGMVIFASIYRGEAGFMPFLVLIAVLLAGSAWCSQLCYFGPVEAALSAKKRIKKASPFFSAVLRYGRLTVLVAGALVALFLRLLDVPAALAVWFGAAFAGISLLVMALASWRHGGMVHCTAFCPLGLVVNVLSRISPWRVKVDARRCNNCGTCETICAHRAIAVESRQKGQASLACVLCRDCLKACPKSAIALHFPFLKPGLAELVFIVIVVVLHTLFIATARPL